MPSTYNYLGIQKMATGEKAGTWGTLTNTNWDIIQQAASGYHSQTIAGGVQTTALLMTDGDSTSVADALTNAARNQVIKLTGTITGNQIVTFPTATEGLKVILNGTTGVFTVQLKGASDTGSGTTFATGDKGYKLVYMSGTDLIEATIGSPAGSDTQLQYNNSGVFGGAAGLTTDGADLSILAQGSLKLSDTDNSDVLEMKADGTTTGYVLTWPATVAGTAGDALTSTTGGVLSWTTITGGPSWQAVITADPANAVAGRGYFCNTTAGVFDVTLPTSATIGDTISFVDYAGTFDSNALTVARNSHNIQGAGADLTVSVERAAFSLVYVDATQGWLLTEK